MDTPQYTIEDMKLMASMCDECAPMTLLLEEADYNPERLKEILKEYGFIQDIKYIFETPLEDIPLLLDQKLIAGYIKFRCEIGK